MRAARIIAAAAALVTTAAPGTAQNWPTRPVTMVVPYPAGAGVDVMGRILSPRLSERLGQQVIVENVSGAGGMTGAARVAKAPPDGYQFVIGNTATHAQIQTASKHPAYNAATDFAPVVLIAQTPQVLLTRKDLPADNLQEFTSRAKRANMQYGSAGVGSPGHLTCALLNTAIGINATHIPYRGAAPALQDLIAGRIDYLCTIAPSAIPQIESKTVKAIAVLSRVRSSTLPTLASAQEQGLADFDASTWFGFFFPKATPAAIVARLRDATVEVMNNPAVLERMKGVGSESIAPERRSPEHLQKLVVSEIEKWAAVIKTAGITAE
jgi:tripartite-type tricarboxylate transporter receptor subunit TctC